MSKRDRTSSDESTEDEAKKLKQETTTEGMKDEDFIDYSPDRIFCDDGNDPTGMAGSHNFLLAKSFYHSRYDDEDMPKREDRRSDFERNAGAVLLYEKDGVNLYKMPHQEGQKQEVKEYNFVSYRNKEFKDITKNPLEGGSKKSTYGHSERILMKMVLDDLIRSHGDEGEITPPSDDHKSGNENKKNYEILKNLECNAGKYKKYLEKKGVTVKMWSERPSCTKTVGAGGPCKKFMKKICPAGSKFGYLVKDYTAQSDNKDGAPKVREAFQKFREAYKAYSLPRQENTAGPSKNE